MNKSTLSLKVGETDNLVVNVAPEDLTDASVTFESSDPMVAIVDEHGKVTAVKAGAADITVTTKIGNKTAKCTVTVTETASEAE